MFKSKNIWKTSRGVTTWAAVVAILAGVGWACSANYWSHADLACDNPMCENERRPEGVELACNEPGCADERRPEGVELACDDPMCADERRPEGVELACNSPACEGERRPAAACIGFNCGG